MNRDDGGWREPTEDEKLNMMRDLTTAQEHALRNLLAGMGDTAVRVRVVSEFEGQINAPVGLEVAGGSRFLVAADGDVREYPREDDDA